MTGRHGNANGWDERVGSDAVTLTPADAGELLTLQLAAWVREAHENETLAIPPLHDDLADVQRQLVDPAWTIWGLRVDGRLVATVRTRLLADDPTTAFVGRLGVVPDLHRRGLGAAMLRFAEARLPVDVRRVELVTGRRSVTNHAFYARAGYAITGDDERGGIVHMAKVVAVDRALP